MTGAAHRPARRRWTAAALLAAGGALGVRAPAAQAADDAYEGLRARGVLRVAVYRHFAPYFHDGKGIDADLAARVAARLGLTLQLMPFDAGENVEDDLRNMVWRGHYLGYGPADAMIHAPYDPALMRANGRVLLVAPYHRDSVAIARRTADFPALDSLSPLLGQRIAVDSNSVGAALVSGADAGRHRDTMRVFTGAQAAIDAFRSGQATAVVALRSELEAGLGREAGVAVDDLPVQQAIARGWAIGFAVKKESVALASALQQAVEALIANGEMHTLFAAHGVRHRRP
jgi:ABC-type amino acid transport substrate-binding protein